LERLVPLLLVGAEVEVVGVIIWGMGGGATEDPKLENAIPPTC
jgi:hypothetical protein